jgi:hypothetical protein
MAEAVGAFMESAKEPLAGLVNRFLSGIGCRFESKLSMPVRKA